MQHTTDEEIQFSEKQSNTRPSYQWQTKGEGDHLSRSLARLEPEAEWESAQIEKEKAPGSAIMSRECEHPTNPV